MTEFWDRLFTVGIKVEVVNNDTDDALKKTGDNRNLINAQSSNQPNKKRRPQKTTKDATSSSTGTDDKKYWIATVIEVSGYRAKLRYEGYEDDDSHDFWLYLYSDDIHGVGWCASQGKALVPPKNILKKQADWSMYLIKKLTGSRTLPANQFVGDQIESEHQIENHQAQANHISRPPTGPEGSDRISAVALGSESGQGIVSNEVVVNLQPQQAQHQHQHQHQNQHQLSQPLQYQHQHLNQHQHHHHLHHHRHHLHHQQQLASEQLSAEELELYLESRRIEQAALLMSDCDSSLPSEICSIDLAIKFMAED